MGAGEGSALAFRVLAKCSTTRARVAEMTLPHSVVDTPVFMPVGTQVLLCLYKSQENLVFKYLIYRLKQMEKKVL